MKQNSTKQFSWVREGIGIRETLSLGKAAITLTIVKKGELVRVFGGGNGKKKTEQNMFQYKKPYI